MLNFLFLLTGAVRIVPLLDQNITIPAPPELLVQSPTITSNLTPAQASIRQPVTSISAKFSNINVSSLDFCKDVYPEATYSAALVGKIEDYSVILSENMPFTMWLPNLVIQIRLAELGMDGYTCLQIVSAFAYIAFVNCLKEDSLIILKVDKQGPVKFGPFLMQDQLKGVKTKVYKNGDETFLIMMVEQPSGNQLLAFQIQPVTYTVMPTGFRGEAYLDFDVHGDQLFSLEKNSLKVYQFSIEKGLLLKTFYSQDFAGAQRIKVIPGYGFLIAGQDCAIVYNKNIQKLLRIELQGYELLSVAANRNFVVLETANFLSLYSVKSGMLLRYLVGVHAYHLSQVFDVMWTVEPSLSSLLMLSEPTLTFFGAAIEDGLYAGIQVRSADNSSIVKTATLQFRRPDEEKPLFLVESVQQVSLSDQISFMDRNIVSGPFAQLRVQGKNISSDPLKAQIFNLKSKPVAGPNHLQLWQYEIRGFVLLTSANTTVLRVQSCNEVTLQCTVVNDFAVSDSVRLISINSAGSLIAFADNSDPYAFRVAKLGANQSQQLRQDSKLMRVSSLVLTTKAVVVGFKIAATLKVYAVDFDQPYGNFVKESYKLDGFFPFKQDISFLPLQLKLCPVRPQVVFVKLVSQVVVLWLGENNAQQIGYFQNQHLSSLAQQWQFYVTQSTVAFLVQQTIYVRSLQENIALREISLNGLGLATPYISTQAQGVMFFATNGGQYLSLSYQQPSHSVWVHNVSLGYPVDIMAATKGTSGLWLAVVTKGRVPGIILDYSLRPGTQSFFRGRYQKFISFQTITLNASTTKGTMTLPSTALLIDHHTDIQTNSPPQSLFADRNYTLFHLNDTDWFNGSRITYKLQCPYAGCDQNLTLVQHFNPFLLLQNIPAQMFYRAPGQPFVWVVTDWAVLLLDDQGNFKQTIVLLPEQGLFCQAALKSAQQMTGFLACRTGLSSFVYVISFASTPQIIDRISLRQGDKVLRLDFQQRLLFVLVEQRGVQVFDLDSGQNLLISNSTWAQSRGPVIDMAVVVAQDMLVLVTLFAEQAVGFINIDHGEGGLLLRNSGFKQLIGSKIDPYITKNNRFIRMQPTDLHVSGTSFKLIALITSTVAAHVKVLFRFSKKDSGFALAEVGFVQAYSRLGQQELLPQIHKGCHVNCNCSANNFVLAYFSPQSGEVTYSLYNYGGRELQEVRGGFTHYVAGRRPAYMSFSDKFVFSLGENLVLCNLSNNVSLRVEGIPEEQGQIAVNVTAVSVYSSSVFSLTLNLQGGRWLFWLMVGAVLGVLLLFLLSSLLWKLAHRKDPSLNSETIIEPINSE